MQLLESGAYVLLYRRWPLPEAWAPGALCTTWWTGAEPGIYNRGDGNFFFWSHKRKISLYVSKLNFMTLPAIYQRNI
jgi:hypothetical protein